MKISDIAQLIDGEILTHTPKDDIDIHGAFAGDLMSDVLASIQPESLLVTGLNNPQVIRTALIADVRLVILARGKIPSPETIDLANADELPIISSPLGVFEISGRLMANNIISYEEDFKLHKCD